LTSIFNYKEFMQCLDHLSKDATEKSENSDTNHPELITSAARHSHIQYNGYGYMTCSLVLTCDQTIDTEYLHRLTHCYYKLW